MYKIRLSHPQRQRLGRLLHMQYTPGELAREVGCSPATIRRAIDAGCPHLCDRNGRYWLVGDEFRAWVSAQVGERKVSLGDDEGYCLSCRAARKFVDEDVVVAPLSPGVEMVRGRCAVCGAKLRRIRSQEVVS